MEIYFQINLFTSLLVLAMVKWGKGNNRANFSLLNFAILAWFVPFAWLAQMLPSDVLIRSFVINQQVTSGSTTVVAAIPTMIDVAELLAGALLTCCLFGISLFISQLISARNFNKSLLNDGSLVYDAKLSAEHQVDIYFSDMVNTGILIGVKHPKIVIAKNIQSKSQLNVIIAHEKSHLAHQDNIKLLLLTGAQCIFWWNPIVRYLVSQSRFYIEALCDQRTAAQVGENEYLTNLAELMLSRRETAQNALVSTMTGNNKHNMSRLKLIKEKRVMTAIKKLAYWLTALTAVTVMVFNTLAMASGNSQLADQEGVLIGFNLKIKHAEERGIKRESTAEAAIWSAYEQTAGIRIGDNYRFQYQVAEQGEYAKVDMKIIEIKAGNEKVVANPILTVAYQQEAMIEIDNADVSATAYTIAFTPKKSAKPE